MMKIKTLLLLASICLIIRQYGVCQSDTPWNGHDCAVVLTYDDGLAGHLDYVIPLLDSIGLKATFYANCDAVAFQNRIPEWRAAAANGHELGNHTLFHPCDASKPSRNWVHPDKDLSKYSLTQILSEIRLANSMLNAVDGKTRRTFAYTCGDYLVNGQDFSELIRDDFVGARGVQFSSGNKDDIDLMHIPAFYVTGHTGEALIGLVEQAREHQLLIVFLFHGVGDDHSLNIAKAEHLKLIQYLGEYQEYIWVAPMVDVAEFMK